MGKSQIIEEIHKMRFEEIYGNYKQNRFSYEEAPEVLGISVRTFYRKRCRYDSEDFNGSFDLRIGRKSSHRAAEQEVVFTTKLYAERY